MAATPEASAGRLTLYVDFMSQPSRACIILSTLHGLPVDVERTLISKGATRSEAFLRINPLGKVTLPAANNEPVRRTRSWMQLTPVGKPSSLSQCC
jgi:hypothetical protein